MQCNNASRFNISHQAKISLQALQRAAPWICRYGRRTGRQVDRQPRQSSTPSPLAGPPTHHTKLVRSTTIHLRPNLAKRVQPPVPTPLARNRMATSADSSVSHEELSMHGSHARLVSHPADRILSALLRLAQSPVVLKLARVSQWRCRKRTTHQTQNLDFPHWGARARLKEGNHESAGDTGSGSLMLEPALVASDPLMELHFPPEKSTFLSLY